MNKIQKLSFSSVGDFLDYLPEKELEIVEELRSLIFECIPEAKEKLSYNVPFYSRKKQICYLWPSSVPWGKVPDGEVFLGFPHGHLLNDDYGLLQTGERKFVRTLSFSDKDSIEAEIVRFYLFEALFLDNTH